MNRKYEEYICSRVWADKRRQRLRLSGSRCEVCQAAKSLQVHHLTYERIFREHMEDLMVLCENHHALIETHIREGRLKRKGNVAELRENSLRIFGVHKEVVVLPKKVPQEPKRKKIIGKSENFRENLIRKEFLANPKFVRATKTVQTRREFSKWLRRQNQRYSDQKFRIAIGLYKELRWQASIKQLPPKPSIIKLPSDPVAELFGIGYRKIEFQRPPKKPLPPPL